MKTKITLALLLLICCSFVHPPKADLAIVYIGDSITFGAGLAQKDQQAPPVISSRLIEEKTGRVVTYANQGRSGCTTVDFLPGSGKLWKQVITAAKSLQKEQQALVFSIMLGTNDSAEEGPTGAPVAPESYRNHLQIITDSLLQAFPESKIVYQQPIWYSENTYNRSKYLAAGLIRLQQYFPEIKELVRINKKRHPGKVFMGDQSAFNEFKKRSLELLQPEKGQMGTFYLHPNEKGAAILAAFWAKRLEQVLH